jgi:hypothetical protein
MKQIKSKRHFIAYNQTLEDYANLLAFENEMEVWESFEESDNYIKAKLNVVKILERLIINKEFLGVDNEAEIIQLNLLHE